MYISHVPLSPPPPPNTHTPVYALQQELPWNWAVTTLEVEASLINIESQSLMRAGLVMHVEMSALPWFSGALHQLRITSQ